MTSKEAFTILINAYLGYDFAIDIVDNHFGEITNKIFDDLEVLEIIKEHKLLNYVLKNPKCAEMYHLTQEELEVLRKAMTDNYEKD